MVDFIERIGDLRFLDVMANRNAVPVMRPLVIEARLHLYAQQTPAVLHEKIVRMAVAVWLGNANSLTRSAKHESEFSKLAHTLVINVALRSASG